MWRGFIPDVCFNFICSETLKTVNRISTYWSFFSSFSLNQKKNKPKEPPKVPQSAPFFIPTVPGLVPRFAVPEQNGDPQQVGANQDLKFMGCLSVTLCSSQCHKQSKLMIILRYKLCFEKYLRSLSNV